jgi:undecaprenyl-diphosphatase
VIDTDVLRTAVLGLIQGLTEFLPVSSSGHLEIAKYVLGDQAMGEESLTVTIILHVATALSTVFVFRADILKILKDLVARPWSEGQEFALKVLISMVPAGLVGFFFEPLIAILFHQRIGFVGMMLLITALLLGFADRKQKRMRPLSRWDALWIGIAQAVAILPGISRSGSTVATSLLLGVDRYQAARFSFLMVIPLILGKIAYDLFKGDVHTGSAGNIALITGFFAAFVAGVIACKWMIRLVMLSKLKYFALYCIAAGIFAIILSVIAHD